MANVKFYQVKKEIGGTAYTAQFNGLSAYLRMIDGCRVEGGTAISGEKLAAEVLQQNIVEPKGLTPDSFEDYETLDAVVAFGRDVAQGRFRDQKKQGVAE